MKKFLNKVLIIDGSYMLMRAMTAPGLSELSTTSGLHSGGFYGFIKMLNKVISESIGYYPIICWDNGHSKRRLELFPNYKHHADRLLNPVLPGSNDDKFLSNLRSERADIIEFTTKLRIPNIRIPGWEGDDLIYLITKVCEKGIVVSDDKDMIQMVSESVSVNRTMSGQILNLSNIDDFFRYPRYEYYKSIIGDPSDNISHCVDKLGSTGASKIAEVMNQIVNDDNLNPHDYNAIFNKLSDEKWIPKWKEVRGLSNKIFSFIESINKFELNMKLADFIYVEVPAEFQVLIESEVEPVISSKPKLFESFRLLTKYEIRELDPGTIMSKLAGSSSILLKNA